MSVDLWGEPTVAYDDPLGSMKAYHRRLEQRLEWLSQLAARLVPARETVDQLEAIGALGQIQHDFVTSLIHHHADEEESLFPRLRERSSALAHLLQALEQDHVACEPLHVRFDRLATRLVTSERIRPEDPALLADLASSLRSVYLPHLAREDELILDGAAHDLAPEQLAQISLEMRERRGLLAQGGSL